MCRMAAQGSQNTLRNKQIAALKRMLNFNAPLSKTASAKEPTWKVLIYDKQGSDIISPLLTVKDLRNLGVTLHLLIDAPREQIADATALYFVMPTKENVTKICQDCRLQLYEAYHFNFITPISRTLLEDLAKGALETNCVTQISKVYDQFLHFISLEEDLFIVNAQRSDELSYYALNRPDSLDTDMKQICDMLVETLFSVFVTAGVVPIIQCPRGNAAEMVAEALDKRLRDNIKDARSSMFSGDNLSFSQLSFSRPLLVILDRNVDLATMLHHTWTYQALGHDVLEMSLNRVTLPPDPTSEGASVAKPPNKTFDLLISDRFWQLHRGSPFPTVADAIQVEVNEYKTSEEKLMRLKAAMSTPDEEGIDSDGTLVDNTAKLTSAISSLPELLERKKSIDLHTNIATALLNQIKERKLDLFFEMEDKLITKSSLDKSVLDVISDPSAGTAEDKLRLFVIYYTLSPDVSDDDLTPYTTALETAGADISALTYLKQWKSLTKMAAASVKAQKPTSSGGASSAMSNVLSQWMRSGSLLEGVRNLVIRTKDLPVTRIMDQLMDLKQSKETEDFRYFDPKLLRASDSSTPRSKTPFQEAYVFVVGAGNYIEYQNLQDYCRRQQSTTKRITYGTSELVNAHQFLAQLSALGKRKN
eukprot:Em0019g180a